MDAMRILMDLDLVIFGLMCRAIGLLSIFIDALVEITEYGTDWNMVYLTGFSRCVGRSVGVGLCSSKKEASSST